QKESDGEEFDFGGLDAIGNNNEDNDDDSGRDRGSAQSKSGRGQAQSRAGENVKMKFIQYEDGTVIDGHRAAQVRVHLRAIFNGYANKGKNYDTWTQVDAEDHRILFNEIVNDFPEFRLCAYNWKSEQVAIENFPGWKLS